MYTHEKNLYAKEMGKYTAKYQTHMTQELTQPTTRRYINVNFTTVSRLLQAVTSKTGHSI